MNTQPLHAAVIHWHTMTTRHTPDQDEWTYSAGVDEFYVGLVVDWRPAGAGHRGPVFNPVVVPEVHHARQAEPEYLGLALSPQSGHEAADVRDASQEDYTDVAIFPDRHEAWLHVGIINARVDHLLDHHTPSHHIGQETGRGTHLPMFKPTGDEERRAVTDDDDGPGRP